MIADMNNGLMGCGIADPTSITTTTTTKRTDKAGGY